MQITGMKLASGRKTPHNTQVEIWNPGVPGQVEVRVKLPWQKQWKNLGRLTPVGTEIILPLKLAFLCHAKEDKQEVEVIGNKLLEDGFLTWYDEKDLLPGVDWQRVIESEIEGCDYFLAFLSSRSVGKTGYVNRELRYALEQRDRRPLGGTFMIPVLLDDCTPPRELKDIQFARMMEPDAYEKLVRAMST